MKKQEKKNIKLQKEFDEARKTHNYIEDPNNVEEKVGLLAAIKLKK